MKFGDLGSSLRIECVSEAESSNLSMFHFLVSAVSHNGKEAVCRNENCVPRPRQ